MKQTLCRKPSALYLFAFAVIAVLMLCAFGQPLAYGDEEGVAHSVDESGSQTNYKTPSEAVGAVSEHDGITIVMDADWNIEENLDIPESKTLTIDMNGHKIDGGGKTALVYMRSGSNLTFKASSSVAKEFAYHGYTRNLDTGNPEQGDYTITSGGLITGGYVDGSGSLGGISMGANCTITLENVAVAGNQTNNGNPSVIKAVKENCTVNLNSGTVVEHNRGGYAVIEANGNRDFTLNMSNAIIRGNQERAVSLSQSSGGKIALNNGSRIENNAGYDRGSGLYLHGDNFTVTGDGTGCITGNWAVRSNQSYGGGIYADEKGVIENVSITDNRSTYEGGGIYLDKEGTVIRNCTITGNSAGADGGGIFVNGDCTIGDGCVITDNYCNSGGGAYEGGGIFVGYSYDVKMSGKVKVTGNTRGKDTDNADDVFLDTISGQTAFAYITGSLSAGSSVGVRTGISDDRRIAKNFTAPKTKDCFFIDLGGYYVSYGTDEGGDAWQRHKDKDFDLSLAGKSLGSYKWKSEVMVNGVSTDITKVFKKWDAINTTGLYPVSDYITDENAYDSQLSFKMPQNNVSLAAEYVTRTRNVKIALQAPKPGSELDSKGTLVWTEGDGDDGTPHDVSVTASWYEKASDKTLTPVSGTAKEGVVYVARLSVAQDLDKELAFAFDLVASDVEVRLTNGTKEELGAAKASVDASGALSITTNGYEAGATIAKVEPISLVFPAGTSYDDFMSKFPKHATGVTAAGTVVSLDFVSGQDLTYLFEDGKLVKPSENPKTLELVLKEPDEAALPDSLKIIEINLSVTDAGADEVAEPVIDLDEGSYSTDEVTVKDGKLLLAVECADADAQIKYNLSHLASGEWVSDKESVSCSDGSIGLPVPAAGEQLAYKLELWAVKGGSPSVVRTLFYTVKNADAVEKHKVTVKYDDTAAEGQHGFKAEETYEVKDGDTFSFVAPSRKGYVFDKWLDADGKPFDTNGMLSLGKVNADIAVTAVYNPVVSGLDVDFNLPEAHKPLATSATSVKAKIADSDTYIDVTKYFAGDDGKIAISWLPSADDGNAKHAATYTAELALKTSSSEDVKYVLAPDPEILVAGYKGQYGAYADERDGAAVLNVVCPPTGPCEVPFLGSLSSESVSFEQAQRMRKKQDEGQGAAAWNLPDQVKLTYKCGESEMLDIAWSSISDFDDSATGEQELIAKGTVNFPPYVDNSDDQGNLISNEVTIKVKVGAPSATDFSAAKVTLSKTSYTYDGKVKKPEVKYVIMGNKVLKEGADYTASVASGKKVGTYAVTVTAKGSYTGKATTSFVVNPKGVTKFKVTKAKKSFKAKWKKAKAQRSGVQVKYSIKKSMANAKTVKAKGAAAKAKAVKKLKAKKKYYVQARTYKVVNGKTYYSGWSAKKAVKTK